MNLPEFGRQARRGGVALVLAGMLSLSACGGGTTESTASPEAGATPAVSGEVQVTEEVATTTETTPTAEASPSRPAPQARAVGQVRDPFVNPTVGQSVAGPTTPPTTSPTPPVDNDGGRDEGEGPPAKPEVVVQKPDIKVTGIVRSGGTYRAILTGPENSYIVAPGEKLGAYSVSSITSNTVTLTYQNHKFTLPLEQETFGPGGAQGGGAATGGASRGGGAPAAPPPPGAPPPGPGR